MAIELDIYALGALLGYTPGQTKSIRDIRIEGEKRITVTRFVQDPDSAKPCRAKANVGDMNFDVPIVESSHGEFPALVVDDIFSFRPKSYSAGTPAEYVKLSKSVVKSLRERQGGQFAFPLLAVLGEDGEPITKVVSV